MAAPAATPASPYSQPDTAMPTWGTAKNVEKGNDINVKKHETRKNPITKLHISYLISYLHSESDTTMKNQPTRQNNIIMM